MIVEPCHPGSCFSHLIQQAGPGPISRWILAFGHHRDGRWMRSCQQGPKASHAPRLLDAFILRVHDPSQDMPT